MSTFWILYTFELKKIWKKKAIWITVIVCILSFVSIILAGTQGDYYIHGEPYCSALELIELDRKNEAALTGTPFDQNLLEQTQSAFREYLTLSDSAGLSNTSDQKTQTDTSALTEFYMSSVRPYKEVWSILQKTTGMSETELLSWTPDETEFYKFAEQHFQDILHSSFLTEEEVAFWTRHWGNLEKPLVYSRTEAYDSLLTLLYTFGVFLLIFITVCLSGLFPDEHTRKTDQMILCSVCGKNTLYWVKLSAGLSFTCATAFGMCFLVFTMLFAVYGTLDFNAPLQLLRPDYSYPLTVGQALLIGYGMMLAAAILFTVCILVLSELFKSGIFSLALAIALLLIGMLINIPEQYPILSQLWNWLPHCILDVKNIFDLQLLSVFGVQFTAWQALPVIYLIACIPITFLGQKIYRRYRI